MRAAWAEAAGGPEQVKVGELPGPVPRDDQVLIRNRAAGVGPWDWKIMAGRWGELKFPYIPGFEAAGVIERAPEGSEFKAGDEVWGRVRRAYAEYVVNDGSSLVAKPDGVSFAEAASLVVSATTSYEGLVERLKLQPGETVLVTAAAGGVGSAAVQLARAFGATVIGVASPGNFDFVRALGVEEVVDYHQPDWPDRVLKLAPGGVDVLFDAAGRETGTRALKAIRDGGRGAFIVFPNPDWQAENRGITGESFSAVSSKEHLKAINPLVAEGKLKAAVTKALPLEEAGEALEESQKGHTQGKIVLEM